MVSYGTGEGEEFACMNQKNEIWKMQEKRITKAPKEHNYVK